MMKVILDADFVFVWLKSLRKVHSQLCFILLGLGQPPSHMCIERSFFFSDDLRFPLVYGEGKRSRLLATIGVTRGFGDHDLKAQSNSGNPVYIKPFLTPQPEVRVLDIENEEVTESDVLIMATDGLWDVVSNSRGNYFL